MNNVIEIKNLNLVYDNIIFKDLSLSVIKNTFSVICGYGKTSLVNCILNNIYYEGEINLNVNKKQITLLTENPMIKNGKISTILYNLLNKDDLEYSKIIKEYKLENLENKNTSQLSLGEKQLISFVIETIKKPTILIMDNSLSNIDSFIKDVIFKNIKKTDMTVIYFTNNTNELLYGNYVGIINNNKINYGKRNEIIKDIQIFKKAKLELPFMVELSDKLKYYDLLDNPIYDIDKLVKYLWK